MIALWKEAPNMALDRLREVAAPTLVVIGDDDLHGVAHAGEMLDALPDAQLAVVPGTSHALAMEKPEVVNRLILDFLEPDQVKKQFGG
jgi:pimeloyl-ACP methyl ester carboxylesterase